MNILVTGASGFIASQIVTDLVAAQHTVTCCVRNVAFTKNLFPTTKIVRCDFIHDTTADLWAGRLNDIDVVINCVGIFYHPNKKIIWAVHYDTPRALFEACVKKGIKKIVQVSALGIEQSDVEYAKSKKAADDFLLALPIKAVVLRPSLVYGHGSYGGTSLFRGLAGLPWLTPVPGKGRQAFQPIHLNDLSRAIMALVEAPLTQSLLLHATSAQKITLSGLLITMRSWLGFPKNKLLFVPLSLIRAVSFFGDLVPYSALNTTAYKMLSQNSISSAEEEKKFYGAVGFVPKEFHAGLFSMPSTVQDRWHARLFFLRPMLQASIAFIWLWTAACGLFFYSKSSSYALLGQMGIQEAWRPFILYGASGLDAIIGLAMVCRFQMQKVCLLQILLILIYSVVVTWKLPYLWFVPFAPIAKNVPLMVAILVLIAVGPER